MSVSSGLILGSNLYGVSTTKEHALGTRACFNIADSSGNPAFCEAVYIEADATLTAGQVCELPLIRGTDAFVVDAPLTTAVAAAAADAQHERIAACVALTDMVDGEYGWAAVKGMIPVSLAANCAAQKLLFTTATAGVLDDADTDYEIVGLFPISAITTAAVADCIAYNDLYVRRDAA